MVKKKSLIFLVALILICITVMSTYFIDRKNPFELANEGDEGALNADRHELGLDRTKNELKIAVSLHTAEYMQLVAQSLEFEGYNRGLKIDVELIEEIDPYDYYKKTSQLGDAPDIMLLDNTWVNEFAALGYLAQLDDILSNDLAELQILPLVSQVKWNGMFWAVPKEVDPYIIAWNSERLLEYGMVELPDNIEDLLELNALLHNPNEGKYGFHLDFDDPLAFISMVWMLGGQFVDVEQQSFVLHHEETIRKLNTLLYPAHYAELNHDINENENENENDVQIEEFSEEKEDIDLLIDESWSEEEFNAWQLLNEGTISMMLVKASDFSKHAEAHVNLTALPLADQGDNLSTPTVQGGWLAGKSFAVSSKSELKKEAFEWIQSVTTVESQNYLMRSGGGLPSMVNAYGEKLNTIPNYTQLVKAIEQGKVFIARPEFPDLLDIMRDSLNKLGLNEITLAELIDVQKVHGDELQLLK